MGTESVKAEKQPEDLPRTMGRDELNLAEFPLTALAHRLPDDCKELVYQDQIRDQGTGELVSRKLTITGDTIYGLPTSLDDDVIVALMYVTKLANNFTSRIVPFSRMALVELLGWAHNGQSLRRLDESLNRWLGVTLRYQNAWWDKRAHSWVSENFHILDNVTLYEQQKARRIKKNTAQGALPLSTFSWNDVVFRSFQSENLKRLDLSLYFKLSLAPSKRAYRFLDKRFYRSQTLRFDLRDFACEHVGFSRDYTAAKIKEKLQPALDELEAIGFLEPLSREQRYEKVARGEWKIVLVQTKAKTEEVSPVTSPAPEPPSLVTELVTRNVNSSMAAELVRRHPAEFIQVKIEMFDWLTEKQDKRVAKNPAGYLVKSITDDYAAIKGFVTKAERRRAEEAKQVKERQEADTRYRKQMQDTAERKEQKAIVDYRASLTPEQLAQLEVDALEHAEETVRRSLDEPGMIPFRKTLLHRITDDHIRRLLRAEGKLPTVDG